MNSEYRVSAVVPAFNEEHTIREVVRTLLDHPFVAEVIVVDDGSTDRTVEQIIDLPITIITLDKNFGKATAMDIGVDAARFPFLFFCDADVIGLDRHTITKLFEPVLSGKHVMYAGIRDRKIWRLNKLLRITPVLGGERILTRELWQRVPAEYKKNFQIEIALNYFAKRMPGGMGFSLMRGVTQIIKEKKYGFFIGMARRIFMMWDVAFVGVKIYGWESIRHMFAGSLFFSRKAKVLDIDEQKLP